MMHIDDKKLHANLLRDSSSPFLHLEPLFVKIQLNFIVNFVAIHSSSQLSICPCATISCHFLGFFKKKYKLKAYSCEDVTDVKLSEWRIMMKIDIWFYLLDFCFMHANPGR